MAGPAAANTPHPESGGALLGACGNGTALIDANSGKVSIIGSALTTGGADEICTRLPEVHVDGHDAFDRPAKRHSALTQGVLSLGAEHLAQGRLTDVQIGIRALFAVPGTEAPSL